MKHLKMMSSCSTWKALGVMLLAVALVSGLRPAMADETWACDSACQQACGCQPACGMQVVERTIWDVVSEPVCVGGCMTSCGHSAASVGPATCDGCDTCQEDSTANCRSLFPWLSKPRVRTRNRLVRKTVLDYVPVTSYVAYDQPSHCCDGACDSACDGGPMISTGAAESSEPEVLWTEAAHSAIPQPSTVKLDLGDLSDFHTSHESGDPQEVDHLAEVVRATGMAPVLIGSDSNDESPADKAQVVQWLDTPNRPSEQDVYWIDAASESLAGEISEGRDVAGQVVESSEHQPVIRTAHRSLIDAGFDIRPSEIPLTAPATLPPVIRN